MMVDSAGQTSGERSSFSPRAVLIGFAVSLVIGFIAALFIYNRFVTYSPTALRRVPADADFVVRLNVERAVVHQPLKSAVFPLLERGRSGKETRMKHIERKTTLELNVDVRELVYARLDPDKWLLIAAGLLRPDEVLEGMGRMLEDEQISYRREGDVLVHTSGVAFGVAHDGTLLLSSDKSVISPLLGEAPELPKWAAPLQNTGMALGIYAAPRPRTAPQPNRGKNFSHLEGGTFTVLADSHFPTHAELRLADRGDWTEEQIDSLLRSKANDFSYLVPLQRLSARSGEGSKFRARGNLSREDFDGAVTRFAELIDGSLDQALQRAATP